MSVDYGPMVEEKRKSKASEPDTGLFIPKGNPYSVTKNSEVLLIQNRKPIESLDLEGIKDFLGSSDKSKGLNSGFNFLP